MPPDDGMLERLGIGKDPRMLPTQGDIDIEIDICKKQIILELGPKIYEARAEGRHSASIGIPYEIPDLNIRKAVEDACSHFANQDGMTTSLDHQYGPFPPPDPQTGEHHPDAKNTHYYTLGVNWENVETENK